MLAKGGGLSSGVCTEGYSVEEGIVPGIPRRGYKGLGGDEARQGGGLGCRLWAAGAEEIVLWCPSERRGLVQACL